LKNWVIIELEDVEEVLLCYRLDPSLTTECPFDRLMNNLTTLEGLLRRGPASSSTRDRDPRLESRSVGPPEEWARAEEEQETGSGAVGSS